MLKHVVLFKFRKDVSESTIAPVIKALGELPSKIAVVREFVFGRDVLHSERSYDLALVSSFDNLEDMKKYQVNPEHQAVATRLREISESIVTVDFEF